MSRKNINKAWLGLGLLLIILFAVGHFLYERQFQNNLDTAAEKTEKEMIFVADLVQKRLEKRDFELAKDFINSWGERTPDIIEIILTTSNGFELAHYSSNNLPTYEFSIETNITYSYHGVATIKLRNSLDKVYKDSHVFLYQLITVYIFIAITFFYLIYTIVRTNKQKHALDFENSQRIRAEKKLKIAHKVLQEKEQDLAITLDSIGDGVITTDASGMITRMNPVAENLTGWSLQEALGEPLKNVFNIIDASTSEPLKSPVEKVLSSGETVHLSNHTLLISRDGSKYHIADSAAPIQEGNSSILGIVLVFNDVTDRKRAEERVNTLFQAIEQSPVSVMITDVNANIEYVNSTFEQNTGYLSKEVLGENPKILKSGKTPAYIYEDMWKTITHGKAWQGELQNRKKNGELFWESAHIAPVIDDDITLNYIAVREDITLRKQQEEMILHQAHFDALTDLPNRFLSLDRLAQLISDAKRNDEFVAVIFLDLDDFKKINDTLGHDTGDKLLVEAAIRLRNAIRGGDTVGRLGGDEFIILLGGLKDVSDARPIVVNLLNQFRSAFNIDSRELVLTASVGISIYPNDGDMPSTLLRNADSAMYHSKEEGRNTYSYFTEAMNKDVSRRLAIEEQLHGALDRNEFELRYQPKVDVASCNMVGVEALLRWNNVALGHVSPDEFIPIAEQTGLIIPIGQFVLSTALGMTADWQKQCDNEFSVAINLSPRQFRDPGLVPLIAKLIGQSGISSQSVELEITEGVLMSGHAHIGKALDEISKLGINIAMDDFGTGYSSLSYLRTYPFGVLKIDRSFINDITFDPADRELVNAAIAMAHSLDVKVVAEGVETAEQLKLLAEQKCEIAQGYLFSKPLSADEITDLLAANNGLVCYI